MNGTTRGGGVGQPPALGVRRVHIYVSGNVQGVYYREELRKQAEHLQVRGFVRNLDDGRVEAVFEGSDHAVNRLLGWCHRGSDRAEVSQVEVQEEEPNHQDKAFVVLR